MIYLANAFSLQMIHGDDAKVAIKTVPPTEVSNRLKTENWVSSMGHQDVAAVASDVLGLEVRYNRGNIVLRRGDVLFVAQVVGGRLPEGATTLPVGYNIVWKQVELCE